MQSVKWLYIGIFVVLIGIAVFALTLSFSSNPRFCASCHIMETRYVSWKNSDHSDFANCLSCHSEPGPAGGIKAHLSGCRYVYAYLRGKVRRPILVAKVPNENCFKCHEKAELSEYPKAGKIHDTYHKIHTNNGLRCVVCHDDQGHAALIPEKSPSAMSLCTRCHIVGSAELSACSKCHPAGPPSPALKSKSVESSQVMGR
jgi:cytochrome c nitrite reductase small subunit